MATQAKAAKKKKKKLIKKILRAFKGSDAYLIEQSQTLCDLFEDDEADFIAFDSTYTAPFRTDVWQAAIDAALTYKDDTTVQAEVLEKTGSVKLQMDAAGFKYAEIIYFAKKAFGKSSVILKQFGRGKAFDSASKSQAKMYNFLDELSQVANKHSVKLGTVGCTQAIIDSIATVRDSYNTENRAQNLLKAERPEVSQGRVILYNALYKITSEVIEAAKTVYKTNPAKLGEYVYHPPIHHRDTIVIQFDAEAEVVTNIDTSSLEEFDIVSVEIEATGSDFDLYASDTPGSEPGATTLTVEDGEEVFKTIVELQALLQLSEVNQFVNTKNTGTTVGHLKITFIKAKN